MPWMGPKRNYYYLSRRRGKRIVYAYIGTGEVAQLAARLDQIEQEQRLERRMDRERFNALVQAPTELDQYRAAVRGVVADVLVRLGFHQHRRQWRKARMTTDLQTARDEATALFLKQKTTAAELETFKQLLDQHTTLPHVFGDMGRQARRMLLTTFKDHATMRAAVTKSAEQLAYELGYDAATQMERLLIEEIVLCWIDYYRIKSAYAQNTSDTFKMIDMEQWERVLASKQVCYLRAIASLARVRRLLRLPGPQVNINMPGGQQLNVAGDVQV